MAHKVCYVGIALYRSCWMWMAMGRSPTTSSCPWSKRGWRWASGTHIAAAAVLCTFVAVAQRCLHSLPWHYTAAVFLLSIVCTGTAQSALALRCDCCSALALRCDCCFALALRSLHWQYGFCYALPALALQKGKRSAGAILIAPHPAPAPHAALWALTCACLH